MTLAWIRQAAGDPAGALEAIDEAEHASPPTAGLLNPAPAQHARLQLAQGDVTAAARWTHENGLGPDDEPDYARESGHLVLARVLLAQQRPAEALALLLRPDLSRRRRKPAVRHAVRRRRGPVPGQDLA